MPKISPLPRPVGRELSETRAGPSLGLTQRPRRNRKADWARRLVRENVLTVDDLIWPLFLIEGRTGRQAVASMPGVDRVTVDEAVREAERAAKLGVPAIAVFPYTDPALRDPDGSEALNPQNLVCRARARHQSGRAEIGLVTDVALDPYTSHGHDGPPGRAAHPQRRDRRDSRPAGPDPGGGWRRRHRSLDMMDGTRSARSATALDGAGFEDVQIMAYAAKYASAFYGPFRTQSGPTPPSSATSEPTRWIPGNTDEALREVALDLEEGADMVMVKPACRTWTWCAG
jgi:porphobilinogen synthase